MSVPSTCETLDYIEMNGAFFDSGITEDSRAIAVSCKFYTSAPASNYMYGAKQNGDNCVFNGVYSNDTFEVNYTEVSFTASNTIVMAQSVSETTLSYGINGMTGTKTMSGIPSGYHILIGACYRNTGAERPYGAPLRVYYFRIVKDGATVRDLIPVRKADGTVCLWDDVTETFITHSGSGTISGYPAPTGKKLKFNGVVPQHIDYIDMALLTETSVKKVDCNTVTVWKAEEILWPSSLTVHTRVQDSGKAGSFYAKNENFQHIHGARAFAAAWVEADFTEFNTLTLVADTTSIGWGGWNVGYSLTFNTANLDGLQPLFIESKSSGDYTNGRNTFTFDISNLSGVYQVGALTLGNSEVYTWINVEFVSVMLT